MPGVTPPGTVPIQLALDRLQSIGVRTAVATEKSTEPTLRVTAVVAAPEDGAAEVHVRSAGFVERVAVTQTGTTVQSGQVLVAIYSPELYQAQTELLAARQWPTADAAARPATSAWQKLRLLGMTEGDIARMVDRGEPTRAVPIYAPESGVVARKNVVLGSYVTPETTLFEIQDLSHVWVVADVFQRDRASLSVGMQGRFRSSRDPDTEVAGKLDLIYPTVDAEARTTRARMRLSNADLRLSPGEYGTVEFRLTKRRLLVVPRSAVIDTGLAAYVYVVEGEGRFSPRSVSVVESEGEDVAIAAGVEAGDRVVSSATFLIDSESRLQASARSLERTP
jgi:Cu(I)/Ag(I) efflux system membrane fusion protein